MKSIKNKEHLVLAAIVVLTASLLLLGINHDSFAHQSGCHRWHSCPSDHGTYECGDIGYCSQCPDNDYCENGAPRSSSGSSSTGSSSTGSSSTGSSSTGSSSPSSSGFGYSRSAVSSSENQIPSWIRSNADWWSKGMISDTEFVKGMEYLIQHGMMKVPAVPASSSSSSQIPSWIKNNAKWWYEGKIGDGDFISGIQFLISNGMIQLSPQNSCQGTALCITGKVEKIVDGDTIYVEKYKIRLSLVDTPETNEAGFSEATAFTSKLCPVGSTVIVDQDDLQPFDVHGRMLGKITCSGKVLNSELLENGYANILTGFCKKSEFSSDLWARKYGC